MGTPPVPALADLRGDTLREESDRLPVRCRVGDAVRGAARSLLRLALYFTGLAALGAAAVSAVGCLTAAVGAADLAWCAVDPTAAEACRGCIASPVVAAPSTAMISLALWMLCRLAGNSVLWTASTMERLGSEALAERAELDQASPARRLLRPAAEPLAMTLLRAPSEEPVAAAELVRPHGRLGS